jgi:membrane protease YdiL (CAAX protease family)
MLLDWSRRCEPMQPPASRILKLVGAGILALLLTVVIGGIWTGLLIANLSTSPAIPWAVIVMALLLWLVWQYAGGRWKPAKTAEARRRNLRAKPISSRIFIWAVVAGLLSITALTGFWIVLSQLVKIPGNPLPDFSQYPWLSVALVLFMASLVGAVTEEAAFRGYFQSLLERQVSGPVAILIMALAIAPGHGVTQGFVWPTLLFYFFVDVMFGVTAYLTKSILPGIVTHTIGLLVFFTLIWPKDAYRLPVSQGGADLWFWIHVAQVILFAILAILAFRRLVKLAQREHAGLTISEPAGR